MTDVVLYARHATPESIENQIRACRECAAQANRNIVGTYQDAGSGNLDLSLRPGLRVLLEDAVGHKFDTVLVEDLCRLSRDLTNLAGFLKKFRSLGIRILTVSDGDLDHAQTGLDRAQARIIRRVFREYAAGVSPHTIAKRLNDEGISPPRGRR